MKLMMAAGQRRLEDSMFKGRVVREITTPYLPRSRCSTAVWGSKIYCYGGWTDEPGNYNNDFFSYDVVTGQFTTLSNSPGKLVFSTLTAYDGFLYLMGGNNGTVSNETIFRYNIATNEWVSLASMEIRRGLATTLGTVRVGGIDEPCIWIFGGRNRTILVPSTSYFRFSQNSVTNLTTQVNPHPLGRYLTMTNCDGDIIFTGGNIDDTHATSDCTRLTVNGTPSYSAVANLPVPLQKHAAANYKGKVMVVGGSDKENDPTFVRSSAIYLLDSVKNTWEKVGDLPSPRESHTLEVVDGRVFVLFGWSTQEGRTNKILELE